MFGLVIKKLIKKKPPKNTNIIIVGILSPISVKDNKKQNILKRYKNTSILI
tara:strand:- start:204 stop:356 length:153 start_codon:yes stop_codon:yes gene_type:complete